ncbi:glycosyl hydrolase [Paenibacillus sp. FSL L8-0470]|uniref:glycosyl hydrolase n=1 Tax=Paenibacillus sp. FSL L8-0470 TaxID=2954688 RepID=UPI0030F58AF4
MMKRLGIIFILLSVVLSVIPAAASANTQTKIYEAEDGILSGTTVDTAVSGFSGTGYVTGFDTAGDSVTVTTMVETTGLYQIYIRYNAIYGYKQANLSINGVPAGVADFAETTEFTEIPVTKALLNAGENTIRIENHWGWYLIDYVKVEPAAAPAPHQVTDALVNPAATPEAKALMGYLVDNYGKAILSGQQEYDNVSWLQANTGKKPAVVGFDLMDYSPSRVERGTTSNEIDQAIQWDGQNGIVTFAWHWNAPKDLIDQPGKEWWRGFYTDSTTFDLSYALEHKASEDYQLLLRDIDAIAVQLKRLQDADVPVLFRPLHEAEGGWFWWGAKGPGPAKELYRIVYDRLTNMHHLNNLIWVWNSVAEEWYPGDDVVDIVSYDSYPSKGDYSPQIGKFDQLVALGNDHKLVALSENGSIPDPELLQLYNADWSWFCTWEGEHLKDGITNSLAHLNKLYNHEYVVTLDELPDWKNNPTNPDKAPEAPSNVAVKAGDNQATISWKASSGAAGYTVQRAAVSGGPYETVATNVTGTSFTDNNVTNGTAYFYVVNAVNSVGTSVNSTEVSVIPQAPATGSLKVQYKVNNSSATDNSISASFNIVSTGTAAVDLNALKIRYYFTKEGSAAMNFWTDWAQIGSSNVTGTFTPLSEAKTGADTYLELSFSANAGSIAAGGQSGDIQFRAAKSDWSNFNEVDDYSFGGAQNAFIDWEKVTLYQNDTLVWGIEP